MGTSPKLATQNTMKLSMLTLIFAVALAVPGSVLGKAQYYRHRQHPLNEAYRILPSLLKAPTTTLSTTVTEVVTTTANVICAEDPAVAAQGADDDAEHDRHRSGDDDGQRHLRRAHQRDGFVQRSQRSLAAHPADHVVRGRHGGHRPA